MNQTREPIEGFPKAVELGGEEIRLRVLGPEDGDKLIELFQGLPQSDLLFLQRDVTDPHEIDAWLQEVAAGTTVTLVAEAEDTLFGEATPRCSTVPWTRHVGTVRVITAAAQRGRGLGHLLINELFQVAALRGIEKLVAEMTVEQSAARQLFEALGFREEGRYRAYVKDRQGATHDLVVMTSDKPSLASPRAADPAASRAWRCDACGNVSMSAEAPARCPDCGAPPERLSPIGDS